jgi:hypothetical protein
MYVDQPLMIKSEDGERRSISCRGVAVAIARAQKRVWQSPSDDVARAFLGRKGDVSPGRSGPGGVGGTGACSLSERTHYREYVPK